MLCLQVRQRAGARRTGRVRAWEEPLDKQQADRDGVGVAAAVDTIAKLCTTPGASDAAGAELEWVCVDHLLLAGLANAQHREKMTHEHQDSREGVPSRHAHQGQPGTALSRRAHNGASGRVPAVSTHPGRHVLLPLTSPSELLLPRPGSTIRL